MDKLIYFGAWDDVAVINIFPDKDIIFVDAQPVSEYDMPYDRRLYRHTFIETLINAYDKIGYHIIDTKIVVSLKTLETLPDDVEKPDYFEPTLLTFLNDSNKRTSKYYVSSAFPTRMCEELVDDLRASCGLIIAGYFPVKSVVEFMKQPMTLYCCDNSAYGSDSEPDQEINIISALTIDKEFFDTIVADIYCYGKEEIAMLKCRDMNELNNVSDERHSIRMRKEYKE